MQAQIAVPDPVTALAYFVAGAVVLAVVAWPHRGLVPRLVSMVRVNERVRIEDALKQLYRAEYEGAPGSVESIAGALQISSGAAARLLARLEDTGLVRADGSGFPLTVEGRAYALRVLRTHRLWERYLADRTGVRPEEWHDEAERQEHSLSSDATDQLAAALGNPLYDPHGDPIPGASGEMPPHRGVALTALRAGDTAVVSHLEDEPREVYEELVAERLAPRLTLEVLPSPPGEVRFRTERGDHTLSPVVARNITVERTPVSFGEVGTFRSLAEMRPGDEVRVLGISPTCAGAERRRLLDLGVVPDTVIRAELQSIAGGPIAYRVRGALIALRAEQAARVRVEPVAHESAV
jgi:DtxR family Mn-dependent transcriptional regulator